MKVPDLLLLLVAHFIPPDGQLMSVKWPGGAWRDDSPKKSRLSEEYRS
jgi:hypothetical protein